MCGLHCTTVVTSGEKEGSTQSLDSVQSLLQDARTENAQLIGRVNACESQVEALKRTKEEVLYTVFLRNN